VPGIRVFLIDDMRNGGDEKAPQGVNEVRLKRGMIVREGLRTTLSDLRLRKQYRSSREALVRPVHSRANHKPVPRDYLLRGLVLPQCINRIQSCRTARRDIGGHR
jgi:hypothetical protein